jgi:UPF0755 protein
VYRHSTAHSSPAQRGRIPRRVLWFTIVLLVLLVGAVAAVRTEYYHQLKPVNGSQKVVLVTIKTGTPANEIGDLLQQQGLIRSATIFQWYIRSNNFRDKLQAGTYALRSSMSVQQIVDVLANGSVKSDLVTILPGQRLDQVRQAFINAGFEPDKVDAALNPSLYASHPSLSDKPADASLEGFLYPDSYQKEANTDPGLIVDEALGEMDKHLTPELRASFAAHGLSVYQAVILASIVEKEVSKQSDRAQAAQVFLKRLQTGMPLGSDVTAYYGSIVAGKTPSVGYDSPYNTRIHKDLPVGPISNVTDSSLQAVAKPAATDWLYFVAGDDGVTYFSKTVEEHEALTKQHCKQLCAPEP